jgi:hypothetical protein
MEQKFEDAADTGEMEITEDYIVLDDASTSHLDLSNLRKRKTKIISSAKETIENGKSIDDAAHLLLHKESQTIKKKSQNSFKHVT